MTTSSAEGAFAAFTASLRAGRRARPRGERLATTLLLALGLAALTRLLFTGIVRTPEIPGVWAISPLLRFDALSLPVFGMTLLIGLAILKYASTYLEGEARQARFHGWFLVTLASVSVLVLSNHLLLLIGARFASSLGLHRLLTFYDERPRARLAAHKKFLVSRLADICLLGFAALLWLHYDTLRLDELFAAHAAAGSALVPGLHLAAVLLACTALLQCAQLPFHGWLMQVMEAPTPVSALLHAGIVNVGGFLLIRCAPLVADSGLAQGLLVGVGGVTAAVAGLVMLTRISIKVMLAWSTCAQMGFMLVECGLGLWSLALLHLMAHSFYKAYTFLSSGRAVEYCVARTNAPADRVPLWRSWGIAALIVLVGATILVQLQSVGSPSPQVTALAVVLGCALVILITEALTSLSRRVLLSLGGSVLGLVALHLGLHKVFATLLAPLAPETGGSWSTAGFVIALFVALLIVHAAVRSAPNGRISRRLYPLFYGGLFLDELSTRLTLRLWPTRFHRHPSHAIHSAASRQSSGSVAAGSAVSGSAATERPNVGEAVDRACAMQAPAWPLDRSIAVNPFWEMRDTSFENLVARLAERSGARLLPRAEHLRPLVDRNVLTTAHLERAAAALDLPAPSIADLDDLDIAASPPFPLWTHWLDAERDLDHAMSWEEEVTHQISQFCAAWWDRGQARWSPERKESLYAGWLTAVRHDHGLALLMGCSKIMKALDALPDSTEELFEEACAALALPDGELERYLHALLLSLNGWASISMFIRWRERLAGSDDRNLRELLAIRLGWELALLRGVAAPEAAHLWRPALGEGAEREAEMRTSQASARVWQRAAELSFQEPLAGELAARATGSASRPRPDLQAAFCIDVRSEVYRRALESGNASVETLGFAGFFGLPIAVQELGTERIRPQLPGLLAPTLLVRERSKTPGDSQAVAKERQERSSRRERWRLGSTAAAASFSVVECFGLLHAWRLLRASFVGLHPAADTSATTRPYLAEEISGGEEVALPRRTELAESILRGLFLGDRPAPLVLLVGHGSSSANNPGAAGLDCGACCGQPGVINARIAASLLNDRAVREELATRGRVLPEDTWFVAGLHDTTTDHVALHDLDLAPDSHRAPIESARRLLREASVRARAERAQGLGLSSGDPARLERDLSRRARDWSQVRPEWGLANNAAFIVAPRERTRGLDLGGRSFLHEYRASEDEGFAVLEGILTAPMLVTHWINLQYYASTVDPTRYGCGNKVLHNVVGGSLGIFEGNGGDLRIGLARQSLHDGREWRHAPLRLSVYVQAPRAAIAAIVAKHPTVAELIDNEWLYLFQLEDESPTVSRLWRGAWTSVSTGAVAAAAATPSLQGSRA